MYGTPHVNELLVLASPGSSYTAKSVLSMRSICTHSDDMETTCHGLHMERLGTKANTMLCSTTVYNLQQLQSSPLSCNGLCNYNYSSHAI